MDQVRYAVALMVVVFVPAVLPFWLLVHPFVRFWRRLGLFWTYTIHGVVYALVAGVLFLFRARLLAIEFGASWVLVGVAAPLFALSLWLDILRWRRLTNRTLMGVPQLSPEGSPGKLATEGIYARMRHPRYVSAVIGLLAWALFSNYLAAYFVVALLVGALLVIVRLEEAELRERFGQEYEEYRRRVPRFIPRFARNN